MSFIQAKSQGSVWQRLTVCFALLFAATSVVILSTVERAWASHFIAVEAKVDVTVENGTPFATLTLIHEWTNSGSFTADFRAPDGSTISISPTNLGTVTGTSGSQRLKYNLSSLNGGAAGIYRFEDSNGNRVSSINVTSSAQFSFQVGFWYDPANPGANAGSPRFTSAVITNIRGGDAFSQNLGAESPNGHTISSSFMQDTTNAIDKNGAPVQTAALATAGSFKVDWTSTYNGDLASLSNGVLTIPAAVSQAFATSTGRRMAVKIRVEERDSNNVLRGYVTRDIGFLFKTSSNVIPTISGVTSNDVVTLQPGQTQSITVTGNDTAGSLTVNVNNLPVWATASVQSGTRPASRTITFSPPLGTAASSRSVEVTVTDDDSFPLTATVSFVLEVVIAPEVVAGDRQVVVSWNAPDVDVGQTITNYSVRYSSDNGTNWTEITRNANTTTTETITGLANGTTYIVQFATWVDGVKGSWSASSAAALPGLPYATVAPVISGTPTIGSVLTVTDPDGNWTDPLGEPQLVTSYRWQANGVDIAGETGTSFTVTLAYVGDAISVVAERTNSAGTGTSDSASVTVANALLTALGVSVGSLSPAFSSDVFAYTVTVPYGTSSVDLTPTFPAGTATVNGSAATSGAAATINTPVGQTAIQVVVTDTASVTYTVTFDRSLPAPDISYAVSSITLAVNVAMGDLVSVNAGGTSTNWTVSPALPPGLTISAASGTIGGTPVSATASAVYTITATNATNSDSFDLTILVVDAPDFAYPSSVATIQENAPMTPLLPVNNGSPIDSWSISPAIGNGLAFDTTTGEISGTPTAAAAGVQYTISATNLSGTTSFPLTIVVGTPPDISYGSSQIALLASITSVNLSPVNSAGPIVSWSVAPALPAGLTLDSSTGVLSGVATEASTRTSYTITANGVVGNSSFVVEITVTRLIYIPPPSATAPVTTVPGSSTTLPGSSTTVPPLADGLDERVEGETPPTAPVTIADGELPEVTPGRWQVTQNGEEVEVVIELLDAETWQIRGDGFAMQIEVSGDVSGAQLGGVITVFAERQVEVRGNGFLPGTFVDVWLFSTPTYLGAVKVGPDGEFEGNLTVPMSVGDGLHTLQANGISKDTQLRSVNLGIRLVNDVEPLPTLPITGEESDSLLIVAWWMFLMGLLVAGGARNVASGTRQALIRQTR